jgi:hypothetical protein
MNVIYSSCNEINTTKIQKKINAIYPFGSVSIQTPIQNLAIISRSNIKP